MKTIVIGLCGAEGAGKSTVAKLLVEATAGVVLPFAKPLKDMMLALGVPSANLYGEPADKAAKLPMLGGKTARQAMQFLGTEWGRDLIHPDLWVNAWSIQVKSRARNTTLIVADDLRFQNEADAVRGFGGTVVCVRRPSVELKPKERRTAHASSRWWELDYSHEIVNDGDTIDLRRQIAVFLSKQRLAA